MAYEGSETLILCRESSELLNVLSWPAGDRSSVGVGFRRAATTELRHQVRARDLTATSPKALPAADGAHTAHRRFRLRNPDAPKKKADARFSHWFRGCPRTPLASTRFTDVIMGSTTGLRAFASGLYSLGLSISSGRTISSNCSSVTRPSASAASRRVLSSANAFLATLAALS